MAAPTPISALVHSSTLVTAGIWVLIKFGLQGGPLVIFGSLTIVLGGAYAVVESDLKKVVAFSTLSQLGLIVFCLGAARAEFRFFHLLAHAFFKSLLFVRVGVGIMGF